MDKGRTARVRIPRGYSSGLLRVRVPRDPHGHAEAEDDEEGSLSLFSVTLEAQGSLGIVLRNRSEAEGEVLHPPYILSRPLFLSSMPAPGLRVVAACAWPRRGARRPARACARATASCASTARTCPHRSDTWCSPSETIQLLFFYSR